LMILLVCSLEPKESSSCSWDASMLIWIWIKRKVENLNLKIEKKERPRRIVRWLQSTIFTFRLCSKCLFPEITLHGEHDTMSPGDGSRDGWVYIVIPAHC
jgi:hypothetical protein